MKDLNFIVKGKSLSTLVDLPEALIELDLKIIVKPIKKKRSRFSKIYSSPIKVKNFVIQSREERNVR